MKLTALFEQFLLENKVDHVLKTYRAKIEKRIPRDGYMVDLWRSQHGADMAAGLYPSAERAIQFLNITDIIEKHLVWVVRQWCAGNFRLEDIEEVHDVLSEFEKVRRHLDNKDLNTYNHISDVHDAVEAVKGKVSNRQVAQKIKLEGAEKILEDGPWIILKLLTKEAAQYYGKGTRWCTAADNDSMFEYYNKQGPLHVIINRELNRKWQAHEKTGQFMDERDAHVPIEDLKLMLTSDVVREFLLATQLVSTSTLGVTLTREQIVETGNAEVLYYHLLHLYSQTRSPIDMNELSEKEQKMLLSLHLPESGPYNPNEPDGRPSLFNVFNDLTSIRWKAAENMFLKTNLGAALAYWTYMLYDRRWKEFEDAALEWHKTIGAPDSLHNTNHYDWFPRQFHRDYVEGLDALREYEWPEYEAILLKRAQEEPEGATPWRYLLWRRMRGFGLASDPEIKEQIVKLGHPSASFNLWKEVTDGKERMREIEPTLFATNILDTQGYDTRWPSYAKAVYGAAETKEEKQAIVQDWERMVDMLTHGTGPNRKLVDDWRSQAKKWVGDNP